jgi:hypothetical protein
MLLGTEPEQVTFRVYGCSDYYIGHATRRDSPSVVQINSSAQSQVLEILSRNIRARATSYEWEAVFAWQEVCDGVNPVYGGPCFLYLFHYV